MKLLVKLALVVALFSATLSSYAQTSNDIDWDNLFMVSDNSGKLDDSSREWPCQIYDDEQWYTAVNRQTGDEGDPKLANSLLRSCQQQLRDKLAGKVQAVTNSYFDQMDIDGDSKVAEHIEGASRTIVDQMINETQEYCRKERPAIYEKGKILLYMSIRVKKQDIVENIVEGIQDDAEARVRFNEKKFREAAFKVFDEDKNQE